MKRPILSIAAGLSMALGFAAMPVQAQNAESYPDRPITLVVGYPAGGSVDLNGRLLAEALADKLDQKVVVENLGGAGGIIGAQKVVRAKPDGYTLLVGPVNEVTIAGLVNPSVQYDGAKDLLPIGLIGTQPLLLAASKASGIKTADDFVKLAKSGKSESYNFGSSGVGTSLHLGGEMINTATGAKIMHVPYKGVAPLVTDLVSGQLNFGMFVLSSGLPQVQADTIVPIGITDTKRSELAPDIPALSENPELKSVDLTIWFGLFAPKDLPEPTAEKLKAALAEVLADPAFKEKYKSTGGAVIDQQPDLATFFESEKAKFKKLADMAGIGIQ